MLVLALLSSLHSSSLGPALTDRPDHRLPCQIRIRPTDASKAPYSAHCRLPIMKLDAGQATAPVPWPIQSIPTASASNPVISSNLRMDFYSLCRPVGCHARGCETRAAGGRISGSNTMTAASARPPHEGQDNYSNGALAIAGAARGGPA